MASKDVIMGGLLKLASPNQNTITLVDGASFNLAGNQMFQKRNVLSNTTFPSPTAAQGGSLFLIDGAALAIALPAVGASDVGLMLDFKVTVAATNVVITAQAGDILVGGVEMTGTTPAAGHFKPNGTTNLVTTLNGTTKGGEVGSWLRFTCLSATSWWVEGVLLGSGTLVSPFS